MDKDRMCIWETDQSWITGEPPNELIPYLVLFADGDIYYVDDPGMCHYIETIDPVVLLNTEEPIEINELIWYPVGKAFIFEGMLLC